MPLVSSIGQSFKVIGSDVSDVKQTMMKAYRDDEFYTRSAWDASIMAGGYVRLVLIKNKKKKYEYNIFLNILRIYK